MTGITTAPGGTRLPAGTGHSSRGAMPIGALSGPRAPARKAKVPAVGEHWGYREKARTLGQPLRPVEVLQLGPPRSRKVRVRWLDGEYDGLNQWVPEVRLVVPWHEAADLARDEDQLLGLRALQPGPPEKVMADAVSTVWFATAEENVLFDVRDRRPLELTVVHVEDRDDAIEPHPQTPILIQWHR